MRSSAQASPTAQQRGSSCCPAARIGARRSAWVLAPMPMPAGAVLGPRAVEQRQQRGGVAFRVLDPKNGGHSDIGDRVLAALPFLLPLADGLPFGQ